MQEIHKRLNKPDLLYSRDDKIYSILFLLKEIKDMVKDKILDIESVQDRFKVEDLGLVLDKLEQEGHVCLYKNYIICMQFYKEEVTRLNSLLKIHGKITVGSSQIPRELVEIKSDEKYYYSIDFLGKEYRKLEDIFCTANLPIDLTQEIDSDLLLVLKQEFHPSTKYGVLKGSKFYPKIFFGIWNRKFSLDCLRME